MYIKPGRKAGLFFLKDIGHTCLFTLSFLLAYFSALIKTKWGKNGK